MPGKMQIIQVIVLVLQYSLLILLYYFLWQVIKIIRFDLADKNKASYSGYKKEARLVVINDGGCTNLTGQTFFCRDNLSLGRSDHNDIVINDSFVSAEHACFSFEQRTGKYWLADLHSTNGTLLNEQQLQGETQLAPGDLIRIGAIILKFER